MRNPFIWLRGFIKRWSCTFIALSVVCITWIAGILTVRMRIMQLATSLAITVSADLLINYIEERDRKMVLKFMDELTRTEKGKVVDERS